MDYEKIIKKGERVEWYGEQVPQELLTNSVIFWCEPLLHQIDVLEGELEDLKGPEKERRKSTITLLLNNVKKAPYSLNGDFYLIKKKKYESEMKIEPPKKEKKSRKIVENKQKVTSTKNSNLIFGKK